jgi:hypothetical protein
MITILATLQKNKKKIYVIIIGKIKACNCTKNIAFLCIENKIIKDLMNAFLN